MRSVLQDGVRSSSIAYLCGGGAVTSRRYPALDCCRTDWLRRVIIVKLAIGLADLPSGVFPWFTRKLVDVVWDPLALRSA